MSLSTYIIGMICGVYLPNGNGYHGIRGVFLSSSVPPHKSPHSRGRELAFLCSTGAMENHPGAATTSLISREFFLVKMLNLISLLYESRQNCRFSFHELSNLDANTICSLFTPTGAISRRSGAEHRAFFGQVLCLMPFHSAPRVLNSEEVLRQTRDESHERKEKSGEYLWNTCNLQ